MADLSKVERWVQSMEKLGQADAPFVFGNYKLTPHELLKHARADDATWKQVQNYI